jgi:hypothetical protein
MSGFPSGRSLAASLGTVLETVISGRANRTVAAAAGLATDAFDAATFQRLPDGTTWCNGEILPRYDWNPNVVRLCPGCIKDDLSTHTRRGEDPVHLRSWQMLFHVTACPRHGLRLLEATAEGRPFAKFPMRLLRDIDPGGPTTLRSLPRHNVPSTAAEAYVLGRLGFGTRIHVPILDAMPLQNAMRLMDRMGAIGVGGRLAYTHGSGLDRNLALNRGLGLFEGKGEGFISLLDELNATVKRKRASWGAAEVYGRAYRWLNEERADPAYRPIIEMVREHALKHVAISPDVPLFGDLIGERRLYRLPHIYEASGVHMDKARKVLVAIGEVGRGVADPLIPRERALKVIELLKSSMTYSDAREYLGMPRGAMRNVLDEGVLRPSLRAGTEGLQDHLFLKSDLDDLLVRCRGEKPRVFRRPPPGHGNIVTAGIRTNSSSATVLRMLLDGTVTAAGVLARKRGLGAVLVKWKHVAAALAPRPEGIMTMTEAARFLRVHHYTLRFLVDSGYIEATSFEEVGRKATRAEFITVEAARRFQKAYVPAHELAMRLGTHVRVLVPRLEKAGIRPAILKVDAGRYYYRSSEAGSPYITEVERLRTL